MYYFKKNKGITLIALVISIIVLLILVGISISMLSGDNGILQKATTAKENTEISALKEQANIIKLEMLIDKKNNNLILTQNDLLNGIASDSNFAGSKIFDNTIVTADQRYDINIDSELNITVSLHIDESANDTLVLSVTESATESKATIITASLEDSSEATFTLGDDIITGTSAEFVVTKNGEYKIIASKGNETGRKVINVTKCKIEEYSNIQENNYKITINGNEVWIPKGFAYGTSSNVGTVANGLVITDSIEEVNGKNYSNGNEFVWIPIDKTTLNVLGTEKAIAAITSGKTNGLYNYQGKLYNYSGTTSTEKNNYGQGTESNREPDVLKNQNCDYNTSYLNGIGLTYSSFATEMQEEYNKLVQSIQTYGGFYFARFEMGKGENNYSKLGIEPTSSAESDTSMWYGLYNKAKQYNKEGITAGMIWGSQYDAVLNYALAHPQEYDKVTAYTNGNHSGKVLKTGIWLGKNQEKDSIINIFDLEGNLYEWTKEAQYKYLRIPRGGVYSVSNYNTSRRESYNGPGAQYADRGSRLSFYINV